MKNNCNQKKNYLKIYYITNNFRFKKFYFIKNIYIIIQNK